MRRRFVSLSGLTLALVFSMTTVAAADTTIGSTTQPSGSSPGALASSTVTLDQLSSVSFPIVVPAGGGRITSWSTNTTGATAGAPVSLVVLHPAGSGQYTVIAVNSQTLPTPLPASGVATFTTPPISVQAGDKIGLNTPTSGAISYWVGGGTPSTDVTEAVSTASPSPPAPGQTVGPFGPNAASVRVNVSAVVSTSVDAGVTTSTAPEKPSVGNLAVLQSGVTASPGGVPVTFTDTVPAGLTIKSAFAGSGSCNISGQTVTCTIPSVSGGGSMPVNVLVTPKATGSYVNHVSVAPTSGATDPNPANNSAAATLNVRNFATNACTVPNLRGAPARVAKRVLKQLGCKVKIKRKRGRGVPHGAVLKSKPKPGTYKLGRKVTLIVRK